ncbi:hypothetical protein ABZ912_42525 [Nonomuraea angiospora]|uniref:hypothetical protein n=1 Tax=Nonomuraea angiospora TaxID=46172 RepID=UPI0034071AFC
MANEIEIVVTGKNRSKPAIDDAKRDARDLSKSYQGAAQSIIGSMRRAAESIRSSLRSAVRDSSRESETGGRNIGRRLISSVVSSMRSGAGKVKETFSSVFQGGLKGALSTPILGPVVIGAALAVGQALAGALATVVSGALVLGVAGGVAGIGVALLAQNKQVKRDFTRTWSEIKGVMTDAAKPLLPVLKTVQSVAKGTVKFLAPLVETGLKIAKGPLQRFVENLGESFKKLGPAIKPAFVAFGGLLDSLGPMLPGIFEEMATAFTGLATTVNENRDLFALTFGSLLLILPKVMDLLTLLTGMFRGTLTTVAGMVEGMLGMVATMVEGLAAIPGPWQESMKSAAESIRGLQSRVADAKNEIENFPRKVELKGEISDLEGKIAAAKRKLKDPKLTRPERTKLRGEIKDLQAKVAAAKSALASLHDKTVFVNAIYRRSGIGVGTVLAPPQAHGGIIGGLGARKFAAGGVSGAGSSLAMVGEQGPELVRLPFGSSVTPAGQSKAQMATSGFGSISMAFRQAGGGDSGGGLAGSMRDLTKALREVISLRDGMSRFTDDVFGQSRALIAYEAAWDNIRKSIKENGRSLNIGTAKGRENKEALLGLADAAHTVVNAMHDLNRPISTIVAKMKEQRAEFIKAARSFGLTSAQAKKLADYYGLIPSKVKSVLTKEKADLAYNKKAEAFNESLQGKATGGIAGGWTLTGERGPELVRLPFGSQVTSANQTAAAMASTRQPVNVVIEVGGGGGHAFDRFMMEWIRKNVHHRGGNVQVAFGQKGHGRLPSGY